MRYKFFVTFLFLVANVKAFNQNKQFQKIIQAQFVLAEKQYKGMLQTHPDITQFPQSTKPNGQPDNRTSDWWCSGFFPGALWYLFEYTNDTAWKNAADKWTRALEKEKLNTSTHDLGFMLYCSYGNGYRLTKEKAYIEPLITGAKSLATRFDAKRGVIRSWNSFNKVYDYPVIIDNMMNLEYLIWAAKYSKKKYFIKLQLVMLIKQLKTILEKILVATMWFVTIP